MEIDEQIADIDNQMIEQNWDKPFADNADAILYYAIHAP